MGGACSTTAEQNYKPEEKVVVQEKVQAKSNDDTRKKDKDEERSSVRVSNRQKPNVVITPPKPIPDAIPEHISGNDSSMAESVCLKESIPNLDMLEKSEEKDEERKSVHLRFVHVNDVYTLENYPRFKTCKDIESKGPDLTLSLLPGDFIAPSLISSLDKGFANCDTVGACGVDYVCFGNHESDIPLNYLQERIKESKFVWVNSNMQGLPLPPGYPPMPEYVVREVKGPSHTRRIALLGLNTPDPSCYSPGVFGGCTIEPVNETCEIMYKKVMELEKPDTIIPMTHQNMPWDRLLAGMNIGFPVIIGGHDHELYHEVVNGVHIIKVGMDAVNFGITDLIWEDEYATEPKVTVTVKSCKDYAPDPETQARVDKHQEMLKELEVANLFEIKPGMAFSSQRIRFEQCTLAAYMLGTLRDALDADCAIMAGGNIRADKNYEGEQFFTYAHLKGEYPFPNNCITVVEFPGSVIADTVKYARQWARLTPPVSKGCFMQIDDLMSTDAEDNVLYIAGNPIKPDRMYRVAINRQVMTGMDTIVPIIDFVKDRQNDRQYFRAEWETMEIKAIYVSYYSKFVLHHVMMRDNFKALDTDNDGIITRDEIFEAKYFKEGGYKWSRLLVDNLFHVAKLGHTDEITKKKVLEIVLCVEDTVLHTDQRKIKFQQNLDRSRATDLSHKGRRFTTIADSYKGIWNLDKMKEIAHLVLGTDDSDEIATELLNELDTGGVGFVTHTQLGERMVTMDTIHKVVI